MFVVLWIESFIDVDVSFKLPDSYHFVARKDRPGSAHGVTAIIARSNIDAVEVDTNTNTEFVAAAFSCKNTYSV
jgi:hypothetical protein